MYVALIYRSLSQRNNEFDYFLENFEIMLDLTSSTNPVFTAIPGDFNDRFSAWWTGDKNTSEGSQLESLTSLYGYQQSISRPTHILPQSLSCIGFFLTNHLNLVVHTGFHPSVHPDINLILYKIPSPPNTTYQRLVRNYEMLT